MNITQRVALEQVKFFARHGYYPEEQKVGNHFLLDIETVTRVEENLSDELSDTINYETLFEIASAEMQIPRKLLETVAQRILKRIIEQFNQVETARVSLRKLNLPMRCELKSALVELSYTR